MTLARCILSLVHHCYSFIKQRNGKLGDRLTGSFFDHFHYAGRARANAASSWDKGLGENSRCLVNSSPQGLSEGRNSWWDGVEILLECNSPSTLAFGKGGAR